jgi:hypothetical protein
MAKGFKHGVGGIKEESPLNFAVTAYPSEVELNTAIPEDTNINNIGVVTQNPITGWYFASEQPGNMAEGEIFFNVGTSCPVAFNALKENNITVYPLSARQFVSGALVDVTAKSYQGGAWVEWIQSKYLFKSGSGEAVPFTMKREGYAVVTIGKDYVDVNRNNLGTSQFVYYTQVSFKDYNWLRARVHETAKGERDDITAALAYSTQEPTQNRNGYTRTAEVVFSETTQPKVYELDISAQNGTFYVAITGGMIGKIYDIWLE